jgi:hypothetical protein
MGPVGKHVIGTKKGALAICVGGKP